MLDSLLLENENGQLTINFESLELKTSAEFVKIVKRYIKDFIPLKKVKTIEAKDTFMLLIESNHKYYTFAITHSSGYISVSEMGKSFIEFLNSEREVF